MESIIYLIVGISILVFIYAMKKFEYNSSGTDEIIEKVPLYDSEDAKLTCGKMLIIQRTYKNGSTRIITKKIRY